ncbi:hypothetical protein ANRL4_02357 [Anaerolineae bacterium]|nr:hypothetical protein ANRL4_02357 [Anaerolineae bacterium]
MEVQLETFLAPLLKAFHGLYRIREAGFATTCYS